MDPLEQQILAIFGSDDPDTSGTTSAAKGSLPQPLTDAGMAQRPGITNPSAVTVNDEISTDTPDEVTRVPTNAELDKDKALEINAQEQLRKSLRELKPADENIGLGFNDDWFGRLGSTAVPHTGLGQDFTRKTGVNDVGHKNTLRYSRLVDALNNKRFISPGQAGVRSTYANDGGRSGLNDKIDYGEVYKMDGLETAESRAQRRAEGYEKEETDREIKRTQDVKDMYADMERLKQLAVLEQAGKLTDTQRAEQQQLFTALLNNQYNIPYIMMQDRFRMQLGMDQAKYNTQLAMNLARYATMNGLTTAQYAGMIGMDQARYNTILNSVTQQFGTQLAEYIQRTIGIAIPADKVNMVLSNPDYLSGAMHGNAWGVGAPDPSARLLAQAFVEMGITDIRNIDINKVLSAQQRLQSAVENAGVTASDASRKRTS
jgi:hypothetical protein